MDCHGEPGAPGAGQVVVSLQFIIIIVKLLFRNIGVSNWNCQGLRDLMSFAKIKPSVLQVRKHVFYSLLFREFFCRNHILASQQLPV